MVQKKLGLGNKVLFVHQGFELYGSDKVLILNIKVVREKYSEAKIVVVLPRKGELYNILKKMDNVEVTIKRLGVIRKYDFKRLNFSAIFRIFTFFRLIRFLNSFDLIYINSIVIIDYILASRYVKSKVIIHVHELPQGVTSKFFNKVLNFSEAHLIFVSMASQRSFNYLKNENQTILWNGVKAIKQIQINDDSKSKINILLIGRINTWKGQSLLIKATTLLAENDRNSIKVRIVGDVFANQQYLKKKLIHQIVDHNLQNTIEILPFTVNPELVYNWADVVVVPSILPEPFGLVAIEAMSIGKLVIAANHGGLTEIIQDKVTGLLFEPGNASILAEKLIEIITKPHLMKELGKKGSAVFQDKFSEEIYIRNFSKTILK